jgi:adenylate cyclase
LRVFGVGQWEHNPRLCKACIKRIAKRPGGAEVELSLLFADVRGSTTLAETMAATDFTRQLNRFYRTTALAVDHANGIIDKVMGDGIMALFVPGISGPDHAAQAISAGRDLLDQSDSHQLPVGAGVHTGVAFVGVVGADEQTLDFTALGDTVNTAARLGSVAAPGELLVSDATMAKSGEDPAGLEHRELQLKGRTEPIGAWTVRSS